MGLKELFGGREDFLHVVPMFNGTSYDIVLRIDGTYFPLTDPSLVDTYGEHPFGTPEEMAARWAAQVNQALIDDGLEPMSGPAATT